MAVAEPATATGNGVSWANMAVKRAAKETVAPSVPLVTDGITAVVDTNAVVALSGAQVRSDRVGAAASPSHVILSHCSRNSGHALDCVLPRECSWGYPAAAWASQHERACMHAVRLPTYHSIISVATKNHARGFRSIQAFLYARLALAR